MRALLALCALLSLVCLLNAAIGDWEPCTNASTLTLNMGNNRLEVHGYQAKVLTVASNGTVLPIWLDVEVFAIQEWLLPSAQRQCQFIGSPYSYPSVVFGMTAYTSLTMDSFMCKSQLSNLTLPNGVAAEQISVLMRHTTHANFTFTFNFTHSLGTYEETYPGTENSDFIDVVHKYRPDAFKLTMAVKGFPYSSPDPTRTYLELDMRLGGIVDRVGVYDFRRTGRDVALMQYNSTDGVFQIINEVDTGFLVDNVTYVNQLDLGSITLDNLPLNSEFLIPFSFTFCNDTAPGYFVEEIIWDPQLSILFNPSFDPASPPSNTRRALTALYIVLPIVAVLVVCGIIVYVIVKPRLSGDYPGRLPRSMHE